MIAHVRSAIGDDRVGIRALTVSEPPAASDPAASQFALVSQTIRQVAPDVVVAPFLLTAATDSRHFSALSAHIYGFSMARGNSELMRRAHGINERVRVADLANVVGFYVQLVRNAAS